MLIQRCVYVLHIWVVFTFVGGLSQRKIGKDEKNLDISLIKPSVTQPCAPSDSCANRCIKESFAPISSQNVTLGHLNCFCDHDCETFNDCCWDYHTECDLSVPAQPKDGTKALPEVEEEQEEILPRKEAFDCIVVDQFSKGSYWMINKCQTSWPEDEIALRCSQVTNNDFLSILPVLGETGWTYRNVFCAQCNNVKKYKYWKVKAQCVRSAPDEVLNGNPEMLRYYVQHFCNMQVQQDLAVANETPESGKDYSKDTLSQLLEWRRSLRPCEQHLIDHCPKGYPEEAIATLCKDYQSIVLAKHNNESWNVFKNPACASCHGYSTSASSVVPPMQPKKGKVQNDEDSTNKCPVWIATYYYDQVFWSLDKSDTQTNMLPAFSHNFKTSYWTPPSFSVLMHFREDGSSEVTYDDGSPSSVTVPPQEVCNQSQVYDPFYGTCRLVVCADDMVFTDDGCIPVIHPSDVATSATKQPIQIVPSLTVTVEVPVDDVENITNEYCSNVTKHVTNTFERFFNTTAQNVTVHETKIGENENNTDQLNDVKADDGVYILTVSFLIVAPSSYSDEMIIDIVDTINEMVTFQKMVVDSDSYRVLVVETSSDFGNLLCRDGSTKVQYNSSQYELHTFDGRQTLYVPTTDMVYPEDEYQLLDYKIKVTNNGAEYGYAEESRAAVCVSDGPLATLSPCNIYLPLNESEYILLENSSMLLVERDVLVPPEQYITFGDGYALCLDGYVPPDSEVPEPVTAAPDHNLVADVVAWVSFGLTIFSLAALTFTFVTYCIFKELRSVAGCNIMNLTVALFLALLTFSVGVNQTELPDICTAITIIVHYLFLATFFWNNVMAYDVWLTFGQGIKKTFRRSLVSRGSFGSRQSLGYFVIRYMMYGWGMPVLLVAICVAIEFGSTDSPIGYRFDPKFPACWISNPITNILAFGLPLGAILLVNGAFFAASIIALRRVNSRSRKARLSTSKASASVSPKVESSSSHKAGTRQSADCVFTFPSTTGRKSFCDMKPNTRKRNPSTSSMTSSMGQARINIILYIKMSTVMGFTWAIGFAAVLVETEVVWYIFELSVPLQGVFIFVAFICKRRVFVLYRNLVKGKPSAKAPALRTEPIRSRRAPPDGQPATLSPGYWNNINHPIAPTEIPELEQSERRSRMYSSSSCDSTRSLHSCCTAINGTGFYREMCDLAENAATIGITNSSFVPDFN